MILFKVSPAYKRAAKMLGVPLAEYIAHKDSGLNCCGKCKVWHEGLRARCRTCENQEDYIRKARKREQVKAWRETLSPEQHAAMLEQARIRKSERDAVKATGEPKRCRFCKTADNLAQFRGYPQTICRACKSIKRNGQQSAQLDLSPDDADRMAKAREALRRLPPGHTMSFKELHELVREAQR